MLEIRSNFRSIKNDLHFEAFQRCYLFCKLGLIFRGTSDRALLFIVSELTRLPVLTFAATASTGKHAGKTEFQC